MFRDMKKNAKDGAIAIGDTNVAIVDANGNYRDMTDILADVEKATEGMTQAERDMALSSIWGTEALKGVYNINKGYAMFRLIDILYEYGDYCIVSDKTDYGVTLYDHIILNGSSVKENDIIY